MMLFNMEWYINQMRWKNYQSDPLPFTLPESKYSPGTNNSIYVQEHRDSVSVDYILRFVQSDSPRTKIKLRNGDMVDFIPTHKMFLPVDSARIMENGTVPFKDRERVVDQVDIKLAPNQQILKGGLAQLDFLGSNQWERPVYYTSGGFDGSLGLEEYYRVEGLAYRVVPVRTPLESIIVMGDINSDTLYQRLMHTFNWGRMNQEDVQLDYYTIRTLSVIRFRSIYTRLAIRLLEEGKKEKAIEVLDRCMELAPPHVLPFDQYVSGITLPDGKGGLIHHEGIIEAYYMCGETSKANEILKEHYLTLAETLVYYDSMKPRHRASIQRETNELIYQMEEMKQLLYMYQQMELMLELGITGQGPGPLPG
jgi:hypothetical protein